MSFRIMLTDTSEYFEANADETLLEAARRSAIELPHACQFGSCGTCRVRITDGAVGYEEFPSGLTEQEAQAGYALSCQARATSDIVLSAARRMSPCSDVARYFTTVLSVQPLSQEVLRLELSVPAEARLLFRAGQYVNVILPDKKTRSFSMASRPHAQYIDFHVARVQGGVFSDLMITQLKSGDQLEIELPHGEFGYHAEDYRPLLLVATGTGIAPIKSILETLMEDEDCPPVTLYWGARRLQDLYLHEEIASWSSRLTDLSYIPVLSRADDKWDGRRGHVQDAVLQDLDDLSEFAIYLCGAPEMIVQAKRDFLVHQASVHHIYAEGFTFAPR